ncbi:putative RNA methyltransferase [Halomicronema hongdechloris C2206]|uniref:RNA methyltransferase n=1 Tax=Halomicronema hongdechloris C2206 TaxID=1641165 RepID=A0A1Z3HPL1_9CYAN|nr:23S rRNA (uracil(1939)-C(5))-methyltransferase RlmD [Halomicronema hongdechloris]ASC72196.1 putative RNA methyltransferase [Halomicronema hongdechloris C2206]
MTAWQQGSIVEVTIVDLSNSGDGVGRWQGRVVFVPDTVPGDQIRARLIQVKSSFARGKLLQLLQPSQQRVRPACIVADKCGGCQWQPVAYTAQLVAKQQLVAAALSRIGGFQQVPLSRILAAASPLGYRNKATYPLVRSPTGQVKAGYYRKGSHKLVNLNQCPVQDVRLNPLLADIKADIQQQGWSIYSESAQQGRLRHLSLRIGRRTGQMLVTLVSAQPTVPDLEHWAAIWLERYPQLVGVCLNHNPAKTNVIFGPTTTCLAGQPYLEEQFAGLWFHITPTTFFQIHTEQAERLLEVIQTELALQGSETVIDAYCGVGSLTLPLAQRAQHCIGLEVQPEAVEQARQNAARNGLTNVEFQAGDVGQLLPQVAQTLPQPPAVVVLDPPRRGCDRTVLEALIALRPQRIAYMSCNPATLARDLQQLCQQGGYQLQAVQPADFFPQTAHVECVAFLVA